VLTANDYSDAAADLEVDVKTIKAIAQVEAAGSGFAMVHGALRVKIKFEGHWFWRLAPGWRKMGAILPSIIYPKWTERWTGNQAGEWNRFSAAFRLDPEAAMKSVSWGAFQIMGFHHKACGFETVGKFVDAMKQSDRAQLIAFCQFIRSDPDLHQSAIDKDWVEFAYRYNGPGYMQNRYDAKLADAYRMA
jgi:hypothetical protein